MNVLLLGTGVDGPEVWEIHYSSSNSILFLLIEVV